MCSSYWTHAGWFLSAGNIPSKRQTTERQPTERQPTERPPTELEQEVTPDDDEAVAMECCNKSSTFSLKLFAFTKKEMLAELQAREGEVENKCLRQYDGESFGRGILQSVHVIRNIRCFKVEITHIDNQIPSGRKKQIAILWVPTMTDRGLEHMLVPQLKKVPTKL
jgi:hypothetical protein